MGYRSYYSLTVKPTDNGDHEAQICEMVGDSNLFDSLNKWYDADEDMKKYSQKYPELVFCVFREGEQSGDLCHTYYKNGKMQECYAEIIYPDYDETKLK